MNKLTKTLALTALALTPLNASAADYIINGDFESGNTDFNTDYTYKTDNVNAAKEYAITDDSRNVHNSATFLDDSDGNFMVVNGDTTPNTLLWEQTLQLIPIPHHPDHPYLFFIDIASWLADNPAEITFSVNGQVVETFTAPSQTGQWETHEKYFQIDPNSDTLLQLHTTSTAHTGNDFAIDNLRLALPEPSSLSLLTLATLATLKRRKK